MLPFKIFCISVDMAMHVLPMVAKVILVFVSLTECGEGCLSVSFDVKLGILDYLCGTY